ncbi:MAG: 50S ribosomal protein L25/general stress protein Ctc [Desulfobacterales bacterium]|nr:50S ribosomal protein L25/general stress protein Ctc [Desulfobacterales bacterium]
METIALKAETRKTKGNSPARALRREGKVPAVLYGPKTEPSMLTLQAYDLEVAMKKGGLGRTVFNLVVDDGAGSRPVMVKEMQRHPLSNAMLHVDLYEVSMDRKIRVRVPVIATGKAVGVENGGVLQIIRRELEVYCLPNEIPANVTIDVTNLDVGNAVHVEDIPMPGNVEFPHETNFTILTVSATRREMEAEAEGAAAEGEAAAAEGEAKKEEKSEA